MGPEANARENMPEVRPATLKQAADSKEMLMGSTVC